jgi:hypothetical protein
LLSGRTLETPKCFRFERRERCGHPPIDFGRNSEERVMELSGKKVAILATHGFEQSELDLRGSEGEPSCQA